MTSIDDYIAAIPKCELHVHLEGTLEADMKFALAERNRIQLPYANADEMRASYIYHDLGSFLKVFYEGSKVLIEERDFYDLCYAYLSKARSQNVVYAEMFFDPQQHTSRGVPFRTIIAGLHKACVDAEVALGIESQLVMCFVRELSAESAMGTLIEAIPYKEWIIGVGLDFDENGNPPSKFAAVFERARAEGFRRTMHCDVNLPDTLSNIAEALDLIGLDRIDHGVNVLDDPTLIATAKARGVTFTLCPYANEVVMPGHRQYPVRRMLDLGLKATLNSDDPAYMEGSYMIENMQRAQRDAGLTRAELLTLTENAFAAAWISDAKRQTYLAMLNAFAAKWEQRGPV